jgi:hypothetical protein
MTLEEYFWHWKLEVWETWFFLEFKFKDGIRRNKTWEQQSRGKEALRRILYKWEIWTLIFVFFYFFGFSCTALRFIQS